MIRVSGQIEDWPIYPNEYDAFNCDKCDQQICDDGTITIGKLIEAVIVHITDCENNKE